MPQRDTAGHETMRWLIELTPPDRRPLRAAGMAGGICTARAHAAAAIAALSRETPSEDAPLTIIVTIGRRTTQFTAQPTSLTQIQSIIERLSDSTTRTSHTP